ncbi:MAG TPA: hypothetical protein VMS74_01720 [Acidimicrobiia bacterium]|nr:hypothetical protein [Acidimicrobiia bacterium]
MTNEMVETIAVVAPHDRLGAAITDRYAEICSRVEFSIGVETPNDEARLRKTVAEIQRG